jgi:hypothetical protein
VASLNRADYITSSEYKAIRLLSKYRRILNIRPSEFFVVFRQINESPNKSFTSSYCEELMDMIDYGQVQLDIEEIRKYSDLIAKHFGYDAKKFFNLIKYEALCLDISGVEKIDNRNILRAISKITNQI